MGLKRPALAEGYRNCAYNIVAHGLFTSLPLLYYWITTRCSDPLFRVLGLHITVNMAILDLPSEKKILRYNAHKLLAISIQIFDNHQKHCNSLFEKLCSTWILNRPRCNCDVYNIPAYLHRVMAVSWLTFTDEIGRGVKVVGGPGVDGMSDDFLDVESTVMY